MLCLSSKHPIIYSFIIKIMPQKYLNLILILIIIIIIIIIIFETCWHCALVSWWQKAEGRRNRKYKILPMDFPFILFIANTVTIITSVRVSFSIGLNKVKKNVTSKSEFGLYIAPFQNYFSHCNKFYYIK